MSITFATGTDYRLVPWTGAAVASGSFTVACRVFPTTIASTETYIILDTSGGATAQMFIDTSAGAGPNNFAMTVSNDAFTIFAEARSPNVVTASVWKHLAATWDGTSVRLYEDGVLVATNTPAATTRAGNWQNWLSPSVLNGSIQDCVGYNAALNADEIMQLYRARMPLRRTNIQVWVPMLTAPGTDNLSGVGPNLILNGSAPTAGPDSAAIPWGVGISPQAFRLQTITTLTANDVETARLSAAALVVANDIETATLTAAAAAATLDTETATLNAAALLTAGGVVSASVSIATGLTANGAASAQMTAVASLVASDVETASMASSGGGAAGGTNGGQGRRFGNRLMPAFSRRG